MLALTAASQAVRMPPPLMNPMRGFRMQIDDINDPSQLAAGLKACATYDLRVTLGYVRLSPYWNISTLPASFLATLDATFAQMRTAGVAVIPNFAYMYGKSNFSQDVEPYTLALPRRLRG